MALGFLDLGIGGTGQADLRFLDAVVDQIATHLDGNPSYISPWDAGFSLGSIGEPDAGYYFSPDKRLLFVFVEEHADEGDFASNRGRIAMIRHTIGRLASDFPDVRAGVTGRFSARAVPVTRLAKSRSSERRMAFMRTEY